MSPADKITYIHTVIFDGPQCSGKTEMIRAFRRGCGGAFLSYEGGALSYMVDTKGKSIREPIPAKVFCLDYKHTLLVSLNVRPLELIKRLTNLDKPRLGVLEKSDYYKRAQAVVACHTKNILIVNNNDENDRFEALTEIYKFLAPRKFSRIQKMISPL